ncbi:MAG: threonine--tRNA ligase [Candidatus Pacebacteria bacterium]|nr:threonine--tRNA ligase [Candidatus Paceibacterota bacterium]MBP9840703.1 threonine--tRNA ligase [Candidatus Paceibacterota bacterium]
MASLPEKRHTLAHLLAAAVLERFPHAKATIGPAIDNGFYYDFDFSAGEKPGDADLESLTSAMREMLAAWESMHGTEVSLEDARDRFKSNAYKLELIEEISAKGEPVTLYTAAGFTDLCRGGHSETPKHDIPADSFVLDRIAGAYWRGDEKNAMLTRIYGLAFEGKEELEAYQAQREEALARDHKKLGKELDLFVFSDVVGKGLPLFTPKGATMRRELERFIVDEEIRRGYLHVNTPDIAKLALYEKSGHYPHYKDSMYAPIQIDEEKFMLRPMTCPHHFELYLRKPASYRELPMRIAELAQLYRYEQSGELAGLERVRTFCLADAHIVCASEEQAVEEVGGALDLIEYVASTFGLTQGEDYWYRLSLGDRADSEKYFKNDEAWEKGEALLRELLTKRGGKFVEAEKEAAFYGPKIDIQMKNVNGKENTAFTVQYDFCMPERFDLTYVASDGTKKRAFVVHRSSIGAIERIMAFLIEKYAGAFPLWLSPVHARILPVGEKHAEYAKEVAEALKARGMRVETDADDSLGKRIRNGKNEKLPYLLVVGDKEAAEKTISVEGRDGEKRTAPLSEFVTELAERIKTRA